LAGRHQHNNNGDQQHGLEKLTHFSPQLSYLVRLGNWGITKNLFIHFLQAKILLSLLEKCIST
jgi:hypothetical protein